MAKQNKGVIGSDLIFRYQSAAPSVDDQIQSGKLTARLLAWQNRLANHHRCNETSHEVRAHNHRTVNCTLRNLDSIFLALFSLSFHFSRLSLSPGRTLFGVNRLLYAKRPMNYETHVGRVLSRKSITTSYRKSKNPFSFIFHLYFCFYDFRSIFPQFTHSAWLFSSRVMYVANLEMKKKLLRFAKTPYFGVSKDCIYSEVIRHSQVLQIFYVEQSNVADEFR